MALQLRQKGFNFHAVVSRTSRTARKLAAKIQCASAGSDFNLLTDCNLILITVPDSQIQTVVTKLQRVYFQDREVIVIHTSGTQASSSLAKLKQNNKTSRIYTASMHPMQTFPTKMIWNKESLENQFKNIYFGIEGEATTYPVITRLIRNLGGRCLKISSEQKALYHMGGVFSSNFLIALLYISKNMYAHIGLKEKKSVDILLPIITQTLNNVKNNDIVSSMTGPASRGDRAVILNHIKMLHSIGSNHLKLYKELTRVCMEIAKTRKHLHQAL